MPTGLPSSIFCQSPAADVGSAARAFGNRRDGDRKNGRDRQQPVEIWNASFRIIIHLTNRQIEWPQTKAISRMVPAPQSGSCPGTDHDRVRIGHSAATGIQLTPSFFCRLDDEVVYWNTSRLSG